MSEFTQVTEYVDRVFKLYDADRLGFFEDFNDEGIDTVEIPLFLSSEIDKETLKRISIHLGLTTQEILNRDEDAAKRYLGKYSFFRLYKEYAELWFWCSRFKEERPSRKERILRIISSDNDVVFDERYDYQSVQTRLIEKLREIDTVMPGTFHENAEITGFKFSAEVFSLFRNVRKCFAPSIQWWIVLRSFSLRQSSLSCPRMKFVT